MNRFSFNNPDRYTELREIWRPYAFIVSALCLGLSGLQLVASEEVEAEELPLEEQTYRDWIIATDPMDTSGLDDDKLVRILQNYFRRNFDGPENWEAIESIRYDGMVHFPSGSYDYVVFKKKPDYYRVVLELQGGRLISGYDGTEAWQHNTAAGGGPVAMPLAKAMNFIRDATPGGHLLYPMMEGKSVRLLKTTQVEGRPCYEIEVILPNGQMIRSALDLVEYAERRQITVDAMTGFESVSLFEDFREVGGVRFPFSSRAMVGDEEAYRVEMLYIRVNLGMMASMFSPPQGVFATQQLGGDSLSNLFESKTVSENILHFGDSASFGTPESRFPEQSSEKEQSSVMEELGIGKAQ